MLLSSLHQKEDLTKKLNNVPPNHWCPYYIEGFVFIVSIEIKEKDNFKGFLLKFQTEGNYFTSFSRRNKEIRGQN